MEGRKVPNSISHFICQEDNKVEMKVEKHKRLALQTRSSPIVDNCMIVLDVNSLIFLFLTDDHSTLIDLRDERTRSVVDRMKVALWASSRADT
jgi:hypothetical protein